MGRNGGLDLSHDTGRAGASRVASRKGRQAVKTALVAPIVLVAVALGGCAEANGNHTSSSSQIHQGSGVTYPRWEEQSVGLSPPARWAAAVAQNAGSSGIVMFGGNGRHSTLGDTWLWNGYDWISQLPLSSPSPRRYASMAYDVAANVDILFGGQGSTGPVLGDTWAWNGRVWTQLHPLSSPPARDRATMAYDPSSGAIILFGGLGSDSLLGDMWKWSGSNWVRVGSSRSPGPRVDAHFACSNGVGGCLLFGGATSPSLPSQAGTLRETWLWDGSDWSENRSDPSPPALENPMMSFDPSVNGIVLFGGQEVPGGIAPSNQTWMWYQGGWRRMNPATTPSGREWAAFAFNPVTRTEMLFGGANPYLTRVMSDTWSY